MTGEPESLLDDRYEIFAVHPGGMGIVFAVTDRETGERFAAKTVKEEFRGDPRVRRRFEREVRTWVRLGRHQNLVEARFVREIAGVPYLFLEYVDGPTLAALLSADGPLNLAQAADFALMYALGLSYAHEKAIGPGASGLVHRDVKPTNLFVTRDRLAKVSDLGIAKVLTEDLQATAEGIGLGTPFYVSPEQLKGASDLDGRADVYSFGAVLYEMLTGRLPLRADALETQIYQVLQVRPDPPSRHRQAVPPALDDLVDRCLAKDPRDRPASFRRVAADLRAILADPALIEADPTRSTCPACEYASARRPDSCPVCGGALDAPAPFRPRSLAAEEAERDPAPARLTIASVEIRPRPVSVGEELTITVSVVNHGDEIATGVEVPHATPDRDTFRHGSGERCWRGEVAPSRPGQLFDIAYSLLPLREGNWTLPEIPVHYDRADGKRVAIRSSGTVPVIVTPNYRLPFTGRREEWSAFTRAVERPSPLFLLVEGVAGGGKERFLGEAEIWLREHGWQVFCGRSPSRTAEPLKVFHDIARGIFRIGPGSLSASSLVARVVDRLVPLIGEDPGMTSFFGAFLRGAPLPEAQGSMRGYLWFRLLAALAREEPVALVLHNLHWGAGDTLALIETLVGRAREESLPLVVIASSLSTAPDERTWRQIAEIRERFAAIGTTPGLARKIVLPPLGPEDVERLLDHVFPGNTFAEDHPWLVPALTSRSGGNPFHLVHILRLLREARDEAGEPLVSAQKGVWTLSTELDEARIEDWIPEAVEGLVRALVAPLPESARTVLECAAVAGEEFGIELLSALVPDREQLDRDLETLEQADLIHVADEVGERFRFANSLTPAVVERLIRERSRRAHARLHRDLARALEATLGRRRLRRAALPYARSLRIAGEKDRAFRWLVVAAEELVRQQVFRRANTVLSQAGALLEDGAVAPKSFLGVYHYLRGEVFRVTGRLPMALAAFDEAMHNLSGERGRTVLARALSRMGKVHEVRGEIDRALSCYQMGAQIREDLGDTAEMAHSLNSLGSLHLLQGEDERALAAFDRARELAASSGNTAALADTLDNLASLHARRGEWEEAESLYRESFELGTRSGDRLGQAQSLNGLGSIAFRRGDLEGAREHFERALELRREVGDREGVANLLSNLGVIHDRRGDLDRALGYYRRSVDAHREIGSRRGLGTVLNNIAVVLLSRGDVGHALSRLEESLRLRREMGDRERMGLGLLNLGEARSLAGQAEAAEAAFSEAEEAFLAAGDAHGVAGVQAARASHYRRRGELDPALEELRKALEQEGRDPRTRSQLHLEMAELHLASGQWSAARRPAERGLELAGEGGDRPGEAQAERILGRIAGEEGDVDGALERLRRAEDLLRGTSGPELARVYLEQGRALSARDPGRSRELLMRARGLLDALYARGASLPERDEVQRLLE